MGALPNDDPEDETWRDVVFFSVMVLILAFAIFAQRWA